MLRLLPSVQMVAKNKNMKTINNNYYLQANNTLQ